MVAQEKMKHAIHLFHIFFVSGLFFYIALARTHMPSWVYPALIGLGAFIFAYHAYKSFFKKDAVINYFHMLTVAPILLYIGIKGSETPSLVFDFMFVLALVSLGYHSKEILL